MKAAGLPETGGRAPTPERPELETATRGGENRSLGRTPSPQERPAYRSLGMTFSELAHGLVAQARRGKEERRSVSPAVVILASVLASVHWGEFCHYPSSPSCSAGSAVRVPKSPPSSSLSVSECQRPEAID